MKDFNKALKCVLWFVATLGAINIAEKSSEKTRDNKVRSLLISSEASAQALIPTH